MFHNKSDTSHASGLTDLGSEAAADSDPPRPASSRLPRPDLTLLHRSPDGTVERVFLVEVKFGPDTRLERKIPPATAKLQPTRAQAARQYDCLATTEVITIGVGGRIPDHTVKALRRLMPHSQQHTKLLQDLNKLAISWLHSIVQARRQLEPD